MKEPDTQSRLRIEPLGVSLGLRKQACEAIKRAIMDMDIYGKPEEIRLDERQLCEALGVSRTPIREALSVLEQEGFVRSIPRRGIHVVRKTKREIVEMITVWAAIESMAARLAAARVTDADLAELRRHVEAFEDDPASHIGEYSEANMAFHRAIIRLGGIELMAGLTDTLFIHMRAVRAVTMTQDNRARRSIADHRAIIDALARHDASLAAHLVREHTMGLAAPVEQHGDFLTPMSEATTARSAPRMNRHERLLDGVTRVARIIEIGPAYNPVAPKAAGWNTHIVDHATQAALREKYVTAGVDLTIIEPVDTVWTGGALHDAVPPALLGGADIMIASHLFEHLPDPIGFLGSAERLLKETGRISLAIPDRRFCFDFFKSPTCTGDILEAQAQRRTRHGLRAAWAERAYAVTINGALGWDMNVRGLPAFMNDFTAAEATWHCFTDDPAAPYEDFHTWYLTPTAFELIVLELGQLGLIDWRIDSIAGPVGFEFFVTLRRGAVRHTDAVELQDRRMTLLRRQLMEQRAQIDLALLRGITPGTPTAQTPSTPAPGPSLVHRLRRLVGGGQS